MKFLKFLCLLIVVGATTLSVNAEQNENIVNPSIVQLLDSTPGVILIQPEALTDRLSPVDKQTPAAAAPGKGTSAATTNTKSAAKKDNKGAIPAGKDNPKAKDKQTATKDNGKTKDGVKGQENKTVTAGSFTIEVYSDNSKEAKNEAARRKASVQSRFPQYGATLRFDSPFWRVRVGNFRTREDAEKAMASIRRAFPSYSAYMRIIGR